MFPSIPVVNTALKNMFDATASIYVDNPSEVNNRMKHELTKLLGTVRCRISYKRVLPIVTDNVVDTETQRIELICAADSHIRIPDGSRIIVNWDDGRNETFYNSGLPRVYTYSVQVALEKEATHP